MFAFKDLAKLLRLEEKDFHRLETLLESYKKENTQTTTQLTDEKDDVLSVKMFLEYLEYEKDVITVKSMGDGEYVALGKSYWTPCHIAQTDFNPRWYKYFSLNLRALASCLALK